MAKKKKAGSTNKNVQKNVSNNVTLEKKSEAAEEIKETSVKEAKESSEKKTSEKKTADKKAEKKPSVFAKIAKYFRECRSEIKKIVWPTPKATFKNVGIVLSVLVIVGLFVYGLDTGFLALLKLVMDI